MSLYRGKFLFLFAIKGLSESENFEICYQVYIIWRKVRNMWQKEMEQRPKLGMLNEIAALVSVSQVVQFWEGRETGI